MCPMAILRMSNNRGATMTDKRKIDVETEESSTPNSQKDWAEISDREIEEGTEVDDEEESDIDETSSESLGVTAALEHPSYEEMEEKLTEAEQKTDENWKKYLAEHAAHDNTRKRLERDIGNAYKYSVEKLLSELLPVIDSLEKSLETDASESEELKHLRDGVELTLKMFTDLLDKQDVKAINPEGEIFDPKHHEAMTMIEAPEAKSNTVVTVFQKGYRLHDRLIRPARVIVAK